MPNANWPRLQLPSSATSLVSRMASSIEQLKKVPGTPPKPTSEDRLPYPAILA
jgi:hypothetical protein